eukprot:1242682-Prymnesium_polylepis.1
MPVGRRERLSTQDVGESIADAAQEEDSPCQTVTKRRVTWTRLTSGEVICSHEVDIADGVDRDAEDEDNTAEYEQPSCDSVRKSLEEEIENVRQVASKEGCTADFTFLSTAHVEHMSDCMTNSMHDMAGVANTFTARSKAEATAKANVCNEIAAEIDELGVDAVRTSLRTMSA